ncbi:HAMP domain-containing histidine kinase [Undibacterium amnicola]|uniref:histidine kinase n=2 Tax=Undibacterium amnicola TaxID=1834038 RepID=A0ABR6XL75_9BURK|nr:HAMP domain-containing histidine kinase [Undibacterium amnicola]
MNFNNLVPANSSRYSGITMRFTRHHFFTNRWTLLGMMLFLTVGLFASSTLGWLWYAEKRATAARQSSLDLLWMEQIITNKLETQQVMLQNWALDLDPASKPSRQEFLRRIDELIKENHAILAVEIIDEQQQRLIGLPDYDQRPAHLPPLNDPLVSEAIQQSRRLNSSAYSQVIEQFAPLWVLALPNSNEQHRLHRIVVTYNLDKLLTQEVPWWFVQRYDLSLVDEHDKQLSPSEGGIVAHNKEINRLDFGPSGSGLTFKTSVRTVQNFDNLLIGLAIAVLLFGILIIWLLRLLRRWIKERKAAQQALRERDELLQHTARLSSLAEFASGMAHELNQPLAAIANYAAAAECLLETDKIQSPKVRQAIEKMGEESRRAGKIMHSMRNFIQKSATPHEPYSISQLVHESIELIEAQARRQHVRIQVDLRTEDIKIDCDAVMLKQVLFNLMRNALDAMDAKQTDHAQQLEIRTEQTEDYLVFSVTDQGQGVQDIDKLFQAFYTTKSEGMGLGLAICRTVIENHGGKIWAENNPSGGASFHFRLPLKTQQMPQTQSAQPVPSIQRS